MQYSNLIFDLDNTLFDFDAGEYQALTELFARHHWPLPADRRQRYLQYNTYLWRQIETGDLTKDELFAQRFKNFIWAEFQVKVGPEIDQEYLNILSHQAQLLPGAEETLKLAKELGFELNVITNGAKLTQEQRLALSGIKPYFKTIIISSEVGLEKPDPQIFATLFDQRDLQKQSSLMIGDGVASDILGAQNFGIDSLWYNLHQDSLPADLAVKYQVANHQQLQTLLRKIAKSER